MDGINTMKEETLQNANNKPVSRPIVGVTSKATNLM